MSTAADVAKFLSSAGVGMLKGTTDAQWPISYGAQPDSPDNFITVYDTQGDGLDTDEQDVEMTTVQVRVRSANYDAGADRQRAIQAWLTAQYPESEQWRYVSISAASSLIGLGRDDKNRHVTVLNYTIIRQVR